MVPNRAAIELRLSPGRTVYVRPPTGTGEADARGVEGDRGGVGANESLGAAVTGGLEGVEAGGVDGPIVEPAPPLPEAGPGAPGPRARRKAPMAAPTIITLAGAAKRRRCSCSRVAPSGPRSMTTGSIDARRPGARDAT